MTTSTLSPDDINLSVTIQYAAWDGERRSLAVALERMLGDIKVHTTSFQRVAGDRHKQGVWGVYKTAIAKAAMARGATHVLTLREDFIPCRDFLAGVRKVLAAVPDQVVSLCSNRPVVAEARRLGHHWALTPDGSWGGAIAMPVDLAWDFLVWTKRYCRPTYQAEDGRVDLFCLATDRWVWTTAPSLLYHNHAAKSMKGHRWEWRREPIWFIGMDRSPLDIDWRPPDVPIMGAGRYAPIIRAAVAPEQREAAGLTRFRHLEGVTLWRHDGRHGDFAEREATVG